MKKLIIILTILFILPTILAANISMKTEFNSQETLIAKVSGNFLKPILDENIFFYRTHVRVPMDYDIVKINDDFYIYALLPDTESQKNYSIVIKNVRYIKNGQSTEEEIKKDFLISEQKADFNIKPGFVVANDDFFIETKNLQDSELEIKINYGNQKSIELESGEIKKINFELKDFDKEFQLLKLT